MTFLQKTYRCACLIILFMMMAVMPSWADRGRLYTADKLSSSTTNFISQDYYGPEDRGKLMIAHDDIFIHAAGPFHIVDQPVQDGLARHLKQGLGEILRQWIQAGGIARGQDDALHRQTPSALSQIYTPYFPVRCGKLFKYSSLTRRLMLSSKAGSISAMQQPLKPAPLKRPP